MRRDGQQLGRFLGRAPGVLVVALLALLAPRAAAAAPTAAPAAVVPRAVLAEATRDAGIVAPGERATGTFTIVNKGDAALEVTALHPEPFMAGVQTDVQGAPVPPGGSATLTVSLDTGSLAGAGTVRVPVRTNDPTAERLVLTLSVEVRPLLFADPGYARYNVVQQEREGAITQTIWSGDGAAFRVLAVESPNDHLRVSFREARPDERRDVAGSQWRVESVLARDAPVGALSGDVVVVTDHPRQQRIRVPLSGFVRPVLAVTPPVAEIGTVDGTRPFRFTLDVKSFSTEPIAIERAACDLKGATVEVVPVSAGRSYKVRVSVPEGLPSGVLEGTVRIFTASAKVPRVEVPVRGRIAERSAAADRR